MPADIPTFKVIFLQSYSWTWIQIWNYDVCFSFEDEQLFQISLYLGPNNLAYTVVRDGNLLCWNFECLQLLVTSEVYHKDINLLSEDFFSTPEGASCFSGSLEVAWDKLKYLKQMDKWELL